MKGVLICGGTGTRLRPLTEITNKSLLPVYDRPLLLFPLQVLLDAGIKDIIVISGNEHIDQMASFLGSGGKFGCKFTYRVQDRPGGIAQALGMAEEFIDGDSVCALLGDNIYFDNLAPAITSFKSGAHIFLKEVTDPERFGVATLETDPNSKFPIPNSSQSSMRIVSIEEKPVDPRSNLAITGCYVYDHRCFDVIRNLQPSHRGELEITDVTRWYHAQNELTATVLTDDWVDAGTFESLHRAAILVRDRKMNTIELATDRVTEPATRNQLTSNLT